MRPGAFRRAGLVPALLALAACAAPTATPDPAQRGALLYAQHCASCHGAGGEGQADWQRPLPDGALPAPPHDASGHTWHHSDADLDRIIAEGGTWYLPDSRMPAFGAVLDPSERRLVLDHIKGLWGPRERAYQAEMTASWAAQATAAAPTAGP